MAKFEDLSRFNWGKECNTFERAVCKNQANLFESCQSDFKCDAFDFIYKFMGSEIAERMDRDVSAFQTAGIKQLGEYLLELEKIKPLGERKDAEALYWIGYMYRYWAWMGTPSKEIIKIAPLEKAYNLYDGFHTLDVKEAIRLFIERAKL